MSNVSNKNQSSFFTWLKWNQERGLVYLPLQALPLEEKAISKNYWFVYGGEASETILALLANIAKAMQIESQYEMIHIQDMHDISQTPKRAMLVFGLDSLNALSKFGGSSTQEHLYSFFVLEPWGVPTLFLDSPAAMLKNPKLKAPAWKAMQSFSRFLESSL